MFCSLCMLVMLSMTSSINSATIPDRTHCHKPFIQGPCQYCHQQWPYCYSIGDIIDTDDGNNNTEKDESKEDVEYIPDEKVSTLSLRSMVLQLQPLAGQKVKRRKFLLTSGENLPSIVQIGKFWLEIVTMDSYKTALCTLYSI